MVRAPNRIHFKSNKDHHGNRTSHNPSQASTRTDPTSGHRDMPRITPTRRRKWASVRAGYLWVSIWGCFVLIKRRICSSPSSSCGGYTGMICEQGAWTGRQNGPWASRNGPQRSATGSLTRLRAARRSRSPLGPRRPSVGLQEALRGHWCWRPTLSNATAHLLRGAAAPVQCFSQGRFAVRDDLLGLTDRAARAGRRHRLPLAGGPNDSPSVRPLSFAPQFHHQFR